MAIEPFNPVLLQMLRNAHAIAVLTGAGISAESGIPTYRDAQSGLWSRFRPEELASPDAFRRDPKLVWEWYEWRRGLVAQSAPNAGHRALARMQERARAFTLITQNVDGLHQRAGSRDVIELHGNIQRDKCFTENVVVQPDPTDTGKPPRCPRCGGLVRPDIVWFGEMLPADAIDAAERAARECDVFFSIGTSVAVFPAAQLPHTARRAGATVIEINKDRTLLSAVATLSIQGAAGEILPRLVDAAWPR